MNSTDFNKHPLLRCERSSSGYHPAAAVILIRGFTRAFCCDGGKGGCWKLVRIHKRGKLRGVTLVPFHPQSGEGGIVTAPKDQSTIRAFYSPGEFAALRRPRLSWAYRLLYGGKIRALTDLIGDLAIGDRHELGLVKADSASWRLRRLRICMLLTSQFAISKNRTPRA